MKAGILFYCIGAGICLTIAAAFANEARQQQNQQPVVRLIRPAGNSTVNRAAPVAYEITVADKEDGNSKYDEINAKEVLLEVRYVSDKSKMDLLLKKAQTEAAGLAVIQSSNCFNCHNFNTKAMGPSFLDIAKKYPVTGANADTLARRIRVGSSGVWGNDKMPAHPELSAAESKSAVEWILKHGHDSGLTYLTGLQGQFLPGQLIPVGKTGGGFILTASYIDHGLKNAAASARLKGIDAIAISAE